MVDVIEFKRKLVARQNENSLTVLHWAHARINLVLESRLSELIDADEALNLIMTILEETEVRAAAGITETEIEPGHSA